jgi:hypothetical protein
MSVLQVNDTVTRPSEGQNECVLPAYSMSWEFGDAVQVIRLPQLHPMSLLSSLHKNVVSRVVNEQNGLIYVASVFFFGPENARRPSSPWRLGRIGYSLSRDLQLSSCSE